MSHTFDYNIYVDGELVDVGRLTVDLKDRIKAYYAAYSIVSEGAQPDEEVEIIMPEWYSAEYSQEGQIDLTAYIHYEWSFTGPNSSKANADDMPPALAGHIDSEVEKEIVYRYENEGVRAEEDVTIEVVDRYATPRSDGTYPFFVVTFSWYTEEPKVGYRSEMDAYIYAYNEGHSDARDSRLNYKPVLTDRERTDFKKIFKQ